jgi:sugar lactone lactonase YvrE
MRATSLEVLVEGLDHPEGVCWDPDAGVLWAGGEDGQLYRVDPDARTVELAALAPGFVLGLAVDAVGRLAVCVASDGSLCVFDGGTVRRVATGLGYPNYPAFGPDGAIWLADSGTWERNDGRVLRIAPTGEVEVFSTALPHFPNGCAVTADGRWLWLVESYEPTVNRLDLESGQVEEVARLEGTVPDGVAFTAGGGVLVSCYRPDRIVHVDRDGSVEVVAEDPQGTLLAAPTNVCFMGRRLDQLVSANLGRWHLTAIDAGLTGLPLHYPQRWAADA